jgi:hypothetical protein
VASETPASFATSAIVAVPSRRVLLARDLVVMNVWKVKESITEREPMVSTVTLLRTVRVTGF